MIVNESRVETTSNIVFDEDVAMGFDASANAFLVNNLIKQYSDPYLAALREYTSNARDAHAAVGQTRPVEVSLPSPLAPNLVIEDFGTGLSREELKGYGQFGASTKRDSNDYVGGFGLGSKSGLAMASQFSVTSVKDGKRNTVIVRRDETGAPSMGFLPEQDVDASVPNGTRVTIPTSERDRFLRAIEANFFYGWEQGTITIDGDEPKVSLFDTSLWTPIGEAAFRSIRTLPVQYNKGHIVKALVGPVAYEVNLAQLSEENVDWRGKEEYLVNLVLRLENGSVEIHPSRETLIYDKRTRAAIAARMAEVIAAGVAEHQKAIDASTSSRQAVLAMLRAEKEGFKGKYTYKGIDLSFKTSITADKVLSLPIWESRVTHSGRSASGYGQDYSTHRYADIVNSLGSIQSIYRSRSILVTGVPEATNAVGRPSEVTGASIYAELEAEAQTTDQTRVNPREYDFYFTTLSGKKVAKKLDKFFLNAFEQVIPVEKYKEVVAEERKRRAAATRAENKANGTTGTTRTGYTRIKKDEVRVLRYSSGGRSTTINTPVDELDDNAVHILVKNGASNADNYVRNSIMTTRGYDRSYNIDTFIGRLVELGYVFIIANANTNTEKYADEIPNLRGVDALGDIIRAEVSKTTSNLSDFDRWAYKQREETGEDRNYFHARSDNFKASDLDKIEDHRVVKFLKNLHSYKERVESATYSLRIFRSVGSYFGVDYKVFTVDTTNSYNPPAFDSDYPMLAKNGNYRHPDLPAKVVIDYVNLVRAAKKAGI